MKRTQITRRRPYKLPEDAGAPKTPVQRPKPHWAHTTRSVAKREARWSLQFRSEDFVRFVKQLACVRCKKYGYIQVHHDPTRGSGGTWKDTSPLCVDCHARRHSEGVISFWARIGTTYKESNALTLARWLVINPTPPTEDQ